MAAQGFRGYLRDVIGVQDVVPHGGGVPGNHRRVAIQDEGLETLPDLLEFDEDGIKILCTSVRKPGGMIPDPANPLLRVPNLGYSISALSERRLKAAVYTAKVYHMIGRELTNETLNRQRIRLLSEHRTLLEDHEDPEKLPQVSRTFGIIKAMDQVPSHLRDRLGIRKVALSYVIRDNVEPAPILPQQPDSAVGAGYDSIMDELIATTPHTGDGYAEDNATVFQILQDMTSGTSFESSIKTYQRLRNGRAAYEALCQHNMGTSKWDKIVKDAETYVMKREWNGKNHRFTLRAHIIKHREAHNEMRRSSDYVQYDVPNEHTRVGRLIKSITTKDPSILAAITHIQGSDVQRNDFEAAADFLLLTAPNNGNAPERVQRIAAVRDNRNKDKKKYGTGDSGVELRYHSQKEYQKLNREQKKDLSAWRRNNQSKASDESSKISSLEQSIATLQATISALTSSTSASTDSTSSSTSANPLTNPLSQRPLN
jgi:ribosomal protein L29